MNAYSDHPKGAPGSDLAISNGCTCPVLDNGHGKGRGNGEFWISANCAIHNNSKDCMPIMEDE